MTKLEEVEKDPTGPGFTTFIVLARPSSVTTLTYYTALYGMFDVMWWLSISKLELWPQSGLLGLVCLQLHLRWQSQTLLILNYCLS